MGLIIFPVILVSEFRMLLASLCPASQLRALYGTGRPKPAKADIYAVFAGKGFSLLSAENYSTIGSVFDFVSRQRLTDSFISSPDRRRSGERGSLVSRAGCDRLRRPNQWVEKDAAERASHSKR